LRPLRLPCALCGKIYHKEHKGVNWQSTYAVKHLEKVIKNAKAREDVPVYSLPTTNKQKSFKYVNMAVLFHDFKSEEHDYLNFTIKRLNVKNRWISFHNFFIFVPKKKLYPHLYP